MVDGLERVKQESLTKFDWQVLPAARPAGPAGPAPLRAPPDHMCKFCHKIFGQEHVTATGESQWVDPFDPCNSDAEYDTDLEEAAAAYGLDDDDPFD